MAYNVPELKWLGVHLIDVQGSRDYETVLHLSQRDRNKAIAMLRSLERQSEDGINIKCQVELQKMLMQNIKAEIQILDDRIGGLDGWLDQKLKLAVNERKSLLW